MATTAQTVLLVDDDPSVLKVLAALLAQDGLEPVLASSGSEALALLEARPIDSVVTDLRMPGMDGMELLAHISERWPEIRTVVLTAQGTIPLAVEAMRLGAADFVLKPFDREEVLFSVRKALAGSGCASPPLVRFSGSMLAESESMREPLSILTRAARGDATVLLRGETGTGKELMARELHHLGPRRAGAFIKILCAALPDTLLESELFGYEKGAFTGAAGRKPGRVELAEGGTLFLDEIGEITPALQVKLLRLVQDREFERLGSSQTLKADVRFVAATHRNLEEMIPRGEFREDLFYRLNVVPIWLPPLRDRADDIPKLAEQFCQAFGKVHGKPTLAFDRAALDLLRAQPWPGNVRQLQNLVERLAVLADGVAITEADVRREITRAPSFAQAAAPQGPHPASLEVQRRQTEREALVAALQHSGNNRTLAARILGVSRRTLYNKIEELGLS